MMKEKTVRQDRTTPARRGRGEEMLGPNSDIGRRLRALYGSIQDEVIPDKFIDLLEQLDNVEASQRASLAQQGE